MNPIEEANLALARGDQETARRILGPIAEELNATGETPSGDLAVALAELLSQDALTHGTEG